MSIRIHRSAETGWTKLANTLLRDADLSLRARGLLVQLLSHEDGFQQSMKYAERECRDGKASISAALHELEAAGYVHKERKRMPDGTTRGWTYHVFDTRAGTTPELSGFTEVGEANLGEANVGESDTVVEPQELEEPQEQKSPGLAPATPPQPRRDELFESVADVCGIDWQHDLTDIARGRMNKAVAELRGVRATPDEVRRRAAIYIGRYGPNRLTPMALVGNWPEIATAHPADASVEPNDLSARIARGKAAMGVSS